MSYFDKQISSRLASRDGFPTMRWGPSGWRLIHLVALNYPLEPVKEDVRQAYMGFFYSLCYVLPCGVCREEFCKMVNGDNPMLRFSPTLFKPTSRVPWSTRFNLFKCLNNTHKRNLGYRANPVRDLNHWLKYYLTMRVKKKS